MECTEEGHVYKLDNTQTNQSQEIVFAKKIGEEMIHDGTTNEEVLEMLIDRVKYLDAKLPCLENKMIIIKLEESLVWLNKRTELCNVQGVEMLDVEHKS